MNRKRFGVEQIAAVLRVQIQHFPDSRLSWDGLHFACFVATSNGCIVWRAMKVLASLID